MLDDSLLVRDGVLVGVYRLRRWKSKHVCGFYGVDGWDDGEEVLEFVDVVRGGGDS